MSSPNPPSRNPQPIGGNLDTSTGVFYPHHTWDELWKQYEHVTELYKFYWKTSMHVSAFFYTLAGAIGAFFITHLELQNLHIVMLAPMILGAFLCVIFGFCAWWCHTELDAWFDSLISHPNLELSYGSESKALTLFLVLCAVGALIIAIVSLFAFLLGPAMCIEVKANKNAEYHTSQYHIGCPAQKSFHSCTSTHLASPPNHSSSKQSVPVSKPAIHPIGRMDKKLRDSHYRSPVKQHSSTEARHAP
jgi:hypothetical protein